MKSALPRDTSAARAALHHLFSSHRDRHVDRFHLPARGVDRNRRSTGGRRCRAAAPLRRREASATPVISFLPRALAKASTASRSAGHNAESASRQAARTFKSRSRRAWYSSASLAFFDFTALHSCIRFLFAHIHPAKWGASSGPHPQNNPLLSQAKAWYPCNANCGNHGWLQFTNQCSQT